MDKKLPSVFKNENISREGNNKEVFYSFLENRPTLKNEPRNHDSYVDRVEYVFNTLVTITTTSDTHITKIVGKLGDHILTSDNRKILLKDIKDIKLKSR